MQVLIIESGKSYFNVQGEIISVEDLSREHLVTILNDIYETDEEIEQIIVEFAEIRNPVEKEIVNQILQKINEFIANVENIRREIDLQFPIKE